MLTTLFVERCRKYQTGSILEDKDEVRWADSLNFEARWEKGKAMGGGGQAHAYRATSKSEPEIKAFLKVLKEQTNPERRRRMFREAAALATYSHPRIPRLLESNAQLYADSSAQLYLVTDLVPGKDLSSRSGKPFSFDDALQIVDQLADVVEYCHERGGIHRDIKPDNVILRDGNADVVLVDFGLTFNVNEQDNWHTGDWQELGNRFLRLPELSSYSVHRHDLRSDVSFLAGILYFCLFGQPPAVLEDAVGRLPHQRDGISLQNVSPNPATARLLARLFDVSFQPRLSDRFSSISEFRKMIQDINNSRVEADADDPAVIAEQIKKGFSTEKTARQQRQRATYVKAIEWIYSIQADVSTLLGREYVPTHSGDYDPATDHPYRNMGLHHHFREHLMRYWMKITFRFVGSELVVTIAEVNSGADEVEVLRTDSEAPNFDVGNRDLVKTRLLKGISRIQEI
ncbi:putative Serine/threonine-protein kinase [Paraburkholderia kururiensis]